MSKIKVNLSDVLTKSKNLIQENIQKLKKLFPQIITDDKIDFAVLKQLLGDEINDKEELYRFVWPGKSQSRREAYKPSTGTLRPYRDESLDWGKTQNLYIEGDNLEVLKLLQKNYGGG
ncbi:MAG: hypothetical protein OXC92_10595 [Flavobacteriaceae bacterium]|nr:hypothetical protein [Flavobacteriaceae bacterium]